MMRSLLSHSHHVSQFLFARPWMSVVGLAAQSLKRLVHRLDRAGELVSSVEVLLNRVS